MPKVYYRSVDDVLYGKAYDKANIFPNVGFSPDFDMQRNLALVEVLRRIPENDYQTLLAKEDSFLWFIPHEEVLAMCYPFHATHPAEKLELGIERKERAEVIYLSPELERREIEIAIAVIAHELAHICLDHSTMCKPDVYEEQEMKAWQLVQKWGFDKEYEKYKKYREIEADGSQ